MKPINNKMAAPVFIVSTGRCGLTMLSNMVRLHPKILSISEFFVYLAKGAFRDKKVSGRVAYRRLNKPGAVVRALLKNGMKAGEVLYSYGPKARYGPEEIPPILCTTLPHLTDDHEQLWDELGPLVRARGNSTVCSHYRFVFEWLAERFGKGVWLERSGGSLLLTHELARHFPDARFVHIYRDGRDTAMSMYRHHPFRVFALGAQKLRNFGMDPFYLVNWSGFRRWLGWLPIVSMIYFRLFSVDRILNAKIELPVFGWIWSNMIERGVEYLNALPKERVLSMRFETVLASPKEEMNRFIDFVGPEFADPDWLEKVSALPRNTPPRWPRLSSDAYAALAEACAPGQKILGYDNQRSLCSVE